MAWRRLSKAQWEAIRVHLPPPKAAPRGGRPRVDDRRCVEGILWILWTGAHWSELPAGMAAPPPAGAGSSTGKRRVCCSRSGAPSWPRSTTSSSCAGTNALPMGASSRRKKGTQGREDHTGQGHEVDGAGRWRGDLRWEQTWRRRPRRTSPSSSRPSTRSRAGGLAQPGGPGNGPSVCSPIGAMPAIPCVPGWPGGALSPSSRLDGITSG
jgi:hypothetical protein